MKICLPEDDDILADAGLALGLLTATDLPYVVTADRYLDRLSDMMVSLGLPGLLDKELSD